MKAQVRRITLAVAMSSFAALAAMLVGCASTDQHQMLSATNVPASEGTVSTARGDNDNTIVEVHVKYLASPWKVAPDAKTYVVWIQPPNGALQNVGGMDVDSNLTGILKTVTPYHAFNLTITPEPSSTVAQPTHTPVFSTIVTDRMTSDQ